MGLDDALIFTRVVECHSFTQAALGLGMQKSTVSRRIVLLEERLGVRLLNRTTRKLRLTEVGQAYYERCRQIMLDFAEAEQAVMQLQLQPSGLLRITAPIEFGQLLLGRVLGEFMREHPQITAEVEITSRKVDPLEPQHTADAAAELGLEHIVITSVDRDDLPDGGASQFGRYVVGKPVLPSRHHRRKARDPGRSHAGAGGGRDRRSSRPRCP